MKLYILALKPINSRRVSPTIKAVLIPLHVLVDIFRLDMIAETISIREQKLSLVTILKLDILIVEVIQ